MTCHLLQPDLVSFLTVPENVFTAGLSCRSKMEAASYRGYILPVYKHQVKALDSSQWDKSAPSLSTMNFPFKFHCSCRKLSPIT